MAHGRLNKCIVCAKIYAKAYRKDNIEQIRIYDRERANLPHRKESQRKLMEKYRSLHRERLRAYGRKRARSLFREKSTTWAAKRLKAAQVAYKKQYPERCAANCLLNNAIKNGKIRKPKICEDCGTSPIRLHGHHGDYYKPLDVIWLCSVCHKARHKS